MRFGDGNVLRVSVTVNALTGLEQTHNNYFDIPWVRQKSIESLRLDGHDSALHRVPSHGKFTIDFFAKLLPAKELVVTFHGANMARHSYPRFERVQSFRDEAPALLAFADPTLGYKKGLLLTWYLGGPGWDPALEMVEIVRRAMAVCGATHVLFVGGSGGGHPALRLSTMMDESTAFVQSPTTEIESSIPRTVEQYFTTVWPGRDRRQVIASDPARFSIPALYSTCHPQNTVYYLQNLNDPTFIKEHYRPLKNVYLDAGAPCGTSADGSKQFVLYDSELERHGPPTRNEFNHHLQQARKLPRPVSR